MQKAKPTGIKGKFHPVEETKAETLKAAGLTVQAAHRCEKIAAIPAEAFDSFLAERKEAQQPVSAKELRTSLTRCPLARSESANGCREW